MSAVTNLVLTFSGLENEDEIIKKISSFNHYPSFNLVSIDDKKLPRGWYGGNKMFEGCLYLGAFNHLDLKELLLFLRTEISWEYIEDVLLIVQEDEDFGFRSLKLV